MGHFKYVIYETLISILTEYEKAKNKVSLNRL